MPTLEKYYWRTRTLTGHGDSGWTDAGFFFTPDSEYTTAGLITYGVGSPLDVNGNDGDFYIDSSTNKIYGAKANGTWPQGNLIVALPAIADNTDNDSVIAQITANRKTALENISIANGFSFTPAKVEEERTVLSLTDDCIPLIRILRVQGSVEAQQQTDQTTIDYMVLVFNINADGDPTDKEIVYQNRNIIPDVIKCWMADNRCGNLAEATYTVEYADGVEADAKGNRIYCAVIHFSVVTRINSFDPYDIHL